MTLGSDLVMPLTSYEDHFVRDVMSSRIDYAKPVNPGFYHLGIYTDQKKNLLYSTSGKRP